MPDWQVATALAISLIVGLATHVFYRRPPAPLWPALPLVFIFALLFSVGDFIANQWAGNELLRWTGMVMVYTGLLTFAPGWWVLTRNFMTMCGFSSGLSRLSMRWLVIVNSLLWVGLITNPWHGQFIEVNPGARSDYGPLWWITASINYLVMLAAMGIHARAALRIEDPVIRSQCRFLVASIAIPLTLSMTYVFSPVELPYDPTSLGFAVACLLFLFAVERRNLFVLERVSLPGLLDDDADAILIVTSHGRLLFANPAAHQLFGNGSLIPGASVETLLRAATPTFTFPDPSQQSTNVRDEEHLLVSPHGREAWVIIDISPVQQSRGVQAGLCLRLRDRTALRNARDDAERRLALLEALSQASGEGLVVKDASGKIRYINEAFARLWNVPLSTIRDWDHDLWTNLAPRLAKPIPAAIEELWSQSGEQFDTEHRDSTDLTLNDGRIFEVENFPVTTDGGLHGRAWRLADVTYARAESQAMIQTQKLEGLGVLAGGIAHDFNNLLVAILGNAELARIEVSPSSPAHDPLADVEAAAVRASELTGQLLAYAGKATFVQENLDLSVLVRDVTELITVSIQKDIQIVFDLQPDLPTVRGGGAELRQVIMNLVTNAADAIGDGPGTIAVRTGIGDAASLEGTDLYAQHGETPNEPVFLCVTDDGIGMDQRTLDRIFDPFFTTKFTGRGLGLAATRGILESHSGSLRIETALGVGSSFRVALPIEDGQRPVFQVPTPRKAKRHRQDCTILVVDDEPSIRSVLSKKLTSVGYTVETCSSGLAALELIEGNKTSVDLVILDITMPGLDGLQTHSLIRVDRPNLPILLSSGYPEEALSTVQEGDPTFDGFIQKPYRSAALLAEIERLLPRGRHQRVEP